MKISVIIPTHNRARTIERAMLSVFRQTYPAHEIIVVDDCSEDNTLEILHEYEDKIKILSNDTNRGVSYSRNAGIKAASGDWYAFLDSDDRWDKTKLETQRAYHAGNHNILISQCDEIWIRNGVRVNPMAKHAKVGGWIFPQCIPRCIVSPSAVIMHKSVLEKVGTFDTHLVACEDYDLWLRIAPHFEIGLVDKKLVTRYGGHEDQLSRRFWGMDRFRITAMEKHLDSKLIREWKIKLIEELVYKCGIVSEGARKRDNPELADRYEAKQQQYAELLKTYS